MFLCGNFIEQTFCGLAFSFLEKSQTEICPQNLVTFNDTHTYIGKLNQRLTRLSKLNSMAVSIFEILLKSKKKTKHL